MSLYPSITHSRIAGHLVNAAKSKRAIFLHGAPGIGKSQGVIATGKLDVLKDVAWGQWAADKGYSPEQLREESWKAMGLKPGQGLPDLEVTQLTIPQMESEDFTGAPFHKSLNQEGTERSTVWAPSDFLRKPYPVILFLDEVSSADVRVQKVLLQIVQERRVFNVALAEGSIVILAGNRAEDRASVKTVPFPLGNRCRHYTMEVDAASWLDWARTQEDIPGVFSGWVKDRGERGLIDFKSDDDSLAQLTPRSFTDAAYAFKFGMEDGMEWSEIRDIIYATVGSANATALCAYLELKDELPSMEDIIKNGRNCKMPKRGQIDRAYFVSSMIMDQLLRMKEYQEKPVKNLFDYMDGLVDAAPDATDAVAWALGEVITHRKGDSHIGHLMIREAASFKNIRERVAGFYKSVQAGAAPSK